MYHAIMRARIRALWRRIGSGDYRAAVATAAPDLHFRFVGDTPVGADLQGPVAFEAWFAGLFARFPGLTMTLTDIVVAGWPWRTTAVVKLEIAAPLTDGSAYRNQAVQWIRLRWGRMTFDEVLEDTKALDDACRRQDLASSRPPQP